MEINPVTDMEHIKRSNAIENRPFIEPQMTTLPITIDAGNLIQLNLTLLNPLSHRRIYFVFPYQLNWLTSC